MKKKEQHFHFVFISVQRRGLQKLSDNFIKLLSIEIHPD